MNNQTSARLKVGVLFGGRSPEHEVSILSAKQVVGFLGKSYEVVPIYITKDGKWLTHESLLTDQALKNFEAALKKSSQLVITPDTSIQLIKNPLGTSLMRKAVRLDVDVIFPVLHGLHGEDGSIQGLLELANIPYVGSGILASAIGIDKVITKKILEANNIPTLDYLAFSRSEWEHDEDGIRNKILKKFNLPVIVKPARLGSSIAVEVASDIDELNIFIGSASKYDTKILIEPYLKNCIEVNCSVLGNENPIASVLEKPMKKDNFLSFKDKYMQGEPTSGMESARRELPARLPEGLTTEVQDLAVKTFRALGCAGVARIDFLIDNDNGSVYINEINTLPGSIAFYLWDGEENGANRLAPEMLVGKLIEIAFEIFREKQRTRFHTDYKLLENIDWLGLKKG